MNAFELLFAAWVAVATAGGDETTLTLTSQPLEPSTYAMTATGQCGEEEPGESALSNQIVRSGPTIQVSWQPPTECEPGDDGIVHELVRLSQFTVYRQVDGVVPAAPASVTLEAIEGGNGGMTAFNLGDLSYASRSVDVGGYESAPCISFGDSGSKLYVCGSNSDEVHQFNLSTAWDVSTATFNQSYSLRSSERNPQAIWWRPDGSGFFSVSGYQDQVFEYECSTDWDISTASYSQKATGLPPGNPISVAFNPTGTIMFIAGFDTDLIYSYSLGTAWDLSTIGSVDDTFDVSTQMSGVRSIWVDPDGDYLFASDNDEIYRYSMSTGWDLTTIGYDSGQNFDPVSQTANPLSITLKPDGTKLYIASDDLATDKVFEYEFSVVDPGIAAVGATSLTGAANLTATGKLSAADALASASSATLRALGALVATGDQVVAPSAALSATGSVRAAGAQIASSSAVLKALGALSATGAQTLVPAAAPTGLGALRAQEAQLLAGAALLKATGALRASEALTLTVSANLTSQVNEALHVLAAQGVIGTASLTGAGSLRAAQAFTFSPTALLKGVGTLQALDTVLSSGQAVLTGTGALRATEALTLTVTANLTQEGTEALHVLAASAMTGSATLTGTGKLQAATIMTLSPQAVLQGGAALRALATLVSSGQALLSGTGALRVSESLLLSPSARLTTQDTTELVADVPGITLGTGQRSVVDGTASRGITRAGTQRSITSSQE